MSSHHIVREKQEPAILVLGLNDFPPEQLGQLLEWSPTVITTNDTAEALNSLGIKIDWILTNDLTEVIQSDVVQVNVGEDSYTTAALKFLIVNGYPSVNIITDNFKLKDYEFFVDKITMVIFNRQRKIYAIHSRFSKWKPAGEVIEQLTAANELHTGGLEKISPGFFKTIRDGFFSLEFSGPFLFLAEAI